MPDSVATGVSCRAMSALTIRMTSARRPASCPTSPVTRVRAASCGCSACEPVPSPQSTAISQKRRFPMTVTRMLAGMVALCLSAGTAQAQRSAPPAVSYDQHVDAGGTPQPAGTLENPLKTDKKAAEDGGKLFSSLKCDGSHGGGALGGAGARLGGGPGENRG